MNNEWHDEWRSLTPLEQNRQMLRDIVQRRKLVLNMRIEALQTMLLEAHEELRKLDAIVDDGIENGRPDLLQVARKEA